MRQSKVFLKDVSGYSTRGRQTKKWKHTVIPSLNGRQSLPVLLYQIRQLQHQVPPIGSWQHLPGRILKSLPGCLDGDINILLPRSIDGSNFRLVPVPSASLSSRCRELQTYEGLIVANFSPDLDGTNSLLMNKPIGCEYLRPLGAVS